MAAQFRLLIKNDQWLILGAVIAIIMFGGIIRNSVAAYYAKYYLSGGDALISPFLTSGVIASVLAMIACTWLTRLYDKIKIFRYTQLLAFVVGGAMYFVQPNSIVLAFTFYIVVTFLTDIQLPIYWASIAESVDYGEMKTGQRVFWPGIWRDSLFPKVRYGAGRGLYRNRFSLSGLSTRRRTNTTGAVGDLPVNDDHSRDT